MPNYVSTLTGQQINDVMTQIDQGVPEGWAVGEKNGIPVSSSSPYYQNNAKYYAENALDSAARAEAAVPAGTAGAVFFDRTQSLTDAQKAQARQNIQAGGSNPNLLDNPWFTVNQRGQSSYSGTAYGFDRWKTYTGNTISKTGDIVNLSSTGNLNFFQPFREGLADFLPGKPVTFSLLLADDTVISVTGYFPTLTTTPQQIGRLDPTGHNIYVYFASAVSAAGIQNPTLQLYAGSGPHNIDFKAMKLELGTVSTLANDAPPNYAEELAKCQRYFVRLNGANNLPVGMGFTRDTYANILVNLPVPMRGSTATVSTNATGFNMFAGTENTTATSISLGDLRGSCLRLVFSGATFTTQFRAVVAIFTGNYYIDISADL